MSWSFSGEGNKEAVVKRVQEAMPGVGNDAEVFASAQATVLAVLGTLDPNANGASVEASGHANYVSQIKVQARYFLL